MGRQRPLGLWRNREEMCPPDERQAALPDAPLSRDCAAGTVLPAQQGARAHPAVQPARSASFGEACSRRSGAAAGATLGRRLTPAAAFLVTSVFPSSQRPWEAIDGGHWAAGGARGGARPEEASGLTPEQAGATSTDALQPGRPEAGGRRASRPCSLLPGGTGWGLGPQTLLTGLNPSSSHGETEGPRRKGPSRKAPEAGSGGTRRAGPGRGAPEPQGLWAHTRTSPAGRLRLRRSPPGLTLSPSPHIASFGAPEQTDPFPWN